MVNSIKTNIQVLSQFKKGVLILIKDMPQEGMGFNGIYLCISDVDRMKMEIYSLTHNETDIFYMDWFETYPQNYEIIG